MVSCQSGFSKVMCCRKAKLELNNIKPHTDRTLLKTLVTTYQNTRRQIPAAHSPTNRHSDSLKYHISDILQNLIGDCSFPSQHDIKFHIKAEHVNVLVLTAHNWHRVVPFFSYGHTNAPTVTVTALVLP